MARARPLSSSSTLHGLLGWEGRRGGRKRWEKEGLSSCSFFGRLPPSFPVWNSFLFLSLSPSLTLAFLLCLLSTSESSLPSPPSSTPLSRVSASSQLPLQEKETNVSPSLFLELTSSLLPSPSVLLVDLGAASIILMSHLGRPDGHVVEKYSLKPVVRIRPHPHLFELPFPDLPPLSLLFLVLTGRQARVSPLCPRHFPPQLCWSRD